MSKVILRFAHFTLATFFSESKSSILISTSIFTDYDLLNLLRELCDNGVSVTIIMSDNIINKSLDFTDYIEAGGEVYIKNKGKYLNNNFYVFDKKKTIIGTITCSYSSIYKNDELAVESEDVDLVVQLENKFNNLLKKSNKYNLSLFKTPLDFESDFVDFEDRLEKSILKDIASLQKIHPDIKFDFLFVVLERFRPFNTVLYLSKIRPSDIERILVNMYNDGLTEFGERGKSRDYFQHYTRASFIFSEKDFNRYIELKKNEIDKGYVKFVELWRENKLENLFEKIWKKHKLDDIFEKNQQGEISLFYM